ncbi:MAG: class I SAM-dependent RNA methyltransferase [bacterium]
MRSRKYKNNQYRQKSPEKEVSGRIKNLGLQGDGVLEVAGKPVHIPYCLPGEDVRALARGGKGELTEIITASAQRRRAPCKHFGPQGGGCGGCSLQHLSSDYYQQWKVDNIVQALAREGVGAKQILPLLSSPLRSRRRAGFHLRRTRQGIKAGFKAKASHQLVPMDECLILAPQVLRARIILEQLTRPLFEIKLETWFTCFVTLCDNGLDVDIAGGLDEAELDLVARETLGQLAAQHKLARLTLNRQIFYMPEPPFIMIDQYPVLLPAKGFLQATKEGEYALQKTVAQLARHANSIADLFCGAGTFALPMAGAGKKVLAVESDQEALVALEHARGALPLTTEQRDLFNRPLRPEELNGYEVVIFDPPRAGAEAQALQLAKSEVPDIIGVSCNPKTFARDAAILLSGGYQLISLQPVDQFLFSPHIELIGHFRRDENGGNVF